MVVILEKLVRIRFSWEEKVTDGDWPGILACFSNGNGVLATINAELVNDVFVGDILELLEKSSLIGIGENAFEDSNLICFEGDKLVDLQFGFFRLEEAPPAIDTTISNHGPRLATRFVFSNQGTIDFFTSGDDHFSSYLINAAESEPKTESYKLSDLRWHSFFNELIE